MDSLIPDLSRINAAETLVCRVETSGMEPLNEEHCKQIAIQMQLKALSSQEQKAKFFVKELEKRNGQSWACMVEPISKFVQCFGVSKRPDSYIRLSCGGDRIRVWRISDPETHQRELRAVTEELADIRWKKELEAAQLINDHNHKEGMMAAAKQELEK